MNKVLLNIENGIATITLNKPDQRNTIEPGLVEELRGAVATVGRRTDVSVVLVQGAGKAFCAGGDLGFFADAGEGAYDALLSMGRAIREIIETLHTLPAIVVASVQGAVAGGGVGLMLAADVVIAAENATLAIAYGALGTSPDFGASYFLARNLGYRKALELYLMPDRLDGRQARELGLVNFTAPAEGLAEATRALVERLAAGPAVAHASAKRLFRQAAETALAQHLDDEIRLFAHNTRHPDFAEGVRAFLEKRAPRFGQPAEA